MYIYSICTHIDNLYIAHKDMYNVLYMSENGRLINVAHVGQSSKNECLVHGEWYASCTQDKQQQLLLSFL